MANPTFLNIPIRAFVINGEAYPVYVREMTITRNVNSHDLVEVSLQLAGEVSTSGKVRVDFDNTAGLDEREIEVQSLAGKPVSFVFGVSPDTEQFIGYIAGIQPDQNVQGLAYDMTLLGASVVMQESVRRFETGKTASKAISDRVNRKGLGFHGDTHPYVWPSIAQTGETDWQKSVVLATTVGFVLLTWGAVVRLHSPVQLFKQQSFRTLVNIPTTVESERQLLDFAGEEKSGDLLDSHGLEMFFFDNNGNVVSAKQTLTGSKPKWLPFTSNPVDGREQAEVVLSGYADHVNRWNQQARARLAGDASFYPGVIVDVKSNERTYNGRWLVTRVQHKMGQESFQTELSLVRRPGVPSSSEASFKHFWTGRGKPSVILRNGEWFSSWADSTAMMVTP